MVIRYRRGTGGRANADGAEAVAGDDRRGCRLGDRDPVGRGQAAIAAMAESELVGLYFGLGAWIRNNLGLWERNGALLESAGETDAYEASMVIVEAVWRRVRGMVPKVH